MRYIIRLLVILILLAGLTVLAYAFVGDLSPSRSPVDTPVTITPQ